MRRRSGVGGAGHERARGWGIAAILCGFSLAGCERIVDVQLEPGPVRLVVEGRIERIREGPTGVQTIRLTTTDDFFSNAPPPPATGAVVTVRDDRGGVFAFAETEPGRYVATGLDAEIGATYTLEIEWDGDTYTATATAQPVAPIDRLYFLYEEKTLIVEEAGYRATIDYVDPPGVENYYLWEELVDGENTLFPDPGNAFNLISEDEFYDGEPVVAYQPNDEIALEEGQLVEVRQIALSRETFDYYQALFEQNALGSGDPFSIPPANVRGNVRNTTTPERRALGYFEAAEVSVATGVVTGSG